MPTTETEPGPWNGQAHLPREGPNELTLEYCRKAYETIQESHQLGWTIVFACERGFPPGTPQVSSAPCLLTPNVERTLNSLTRSAPLRLRSRSSHGWCPCPGVQCCIPKEDVKESMRPLVKDITNKYALRHVPDVNVTPPM